MKNTLRCVIKRLTFTSGEGIVVDVGSQYSVSCYFICRRHLPSPASNDEAAHTNISRLSCTALLMPVQFIRIKGASTTEKKSACQYDHLHDWGPGLVVCDSWDPDDLDTPHGRHVADSRDFPNRINIHSTFSPRAPIVWSSATPTKLWAMRGILSNGS